MLECGDRSQNFLIDLYSCAAAYPMCSTVYFVSVLAFIGVGIFSILQRRTDLGYFCTIGALAFYALFAQGDDTAHHVFRIAAIADQLQRRDVSLLLINPTTGEAFPVFVYYSYIPYLFPVLLNILGIPALWAFKLTMASLVFVLGSGLYALANGKSKAHEPRCDTLLYICMLFICANYIYGVWQSRCALAEIVVYALIPWAVRYMIAPDSAKALTGIFFLQISTHPLVFLHSLVCEATVAFGVSGSSVHAVARRCLVSAFVALVLAIPMWLPQFLWLHDVLSVKAFPFNFADTFLTLRQLFDPWFVYNTGIFLPLSLALMIGAARFRLPAGVWLMIGLFLALMAAQTVYLRGLTLHLPFLEQSQFVWRLMFPAAFIAFGALLVGWRFTSAPTDRGLGLLTLASVAWVALAPLGSAPSAIAALSTPRSNTDIIASGYLTMHNVWGVALFGPDYSGLPKDCDDTNRAAIRDVSYVALRSGLAAGTTFITAANAPIGFVTYSADGAQLEPSACGRLIVLGPLKPGSFVRASEGGLQALLAARALALAGGLFCIWALVPLAWRSRLAGRAGFAPKGPRLGRSP